LKILELDEPLIVVVWLAAGLNVTVLDALEPGLALIESGRFHLA
jgi:hypothetical protein